MHEQIVIQDREELFYLLSEAAEFEHSVMCSYLYTMWSLKSDAAEGVTAAELAAIDGWRRSIKQVALEEMLHPRTGQQHPRGNRCFAPSVATGVPSAARPVSG